MESRIRMNYNDGMSQGIEAIYEGGVFKPVAPVDLPEHQRVTIHVPAIPKVSGSTTSFDDAPSLEELALDQGVEPIEDPRTVGGDFWPDDERPDDFIATMRRWRSEERK